MRVTCTRVYGEARAAGEKTPWQNLRRKENVWTERHAAKNGSGSGIGRVRVGSGEGPSAGTGHREPNADPPGASSALREGLFCRTINFSSSQAA